MATATKDAWLVIDLNPDVHAGVSHSRATASSGIRIRIANRLASVFP